ncbi:MAG: tetratricopeptide repeat protein [Bacteroidia bacterium]|nr:tetratricopeptide repeat protein [Bacteroidia bacterium]
MKILSLQPVDLKKNMSIKTSWKFYLLLLFTFWFSNQIFAQTLEDAIKAIDKEEYSKAKTILNTLISQNPKKPELYYYLGVACFRDAKDIEEDKQRIPELEKAKDAYQKGIAANSKYAKNYAGLGEYYAFSRNLPEAKKNFDQALTLSNSNDLDVLVTVAEAYIAANVKDLSEATKLLTKAQNMDSKNEHVNLALGDVWLKQNVNELAKTYYEKAIAANAKSVIAHFKLGVLYVKMSDYKNGADMIMKALQLDPSFAPAYRELGELYFLAKDYKRAKENYQEYVKRKQGDIQAEIRYATFLYLSKDYAAAVSQINQVLKTVENNVLLRLLGYSNYEVGAAQASQPATEHYNNAKNALDKYFTRIDPKNIIALDYEYYGHILDKLGQDSLAVEYYEKAIAKDATKYTLYSEIADAWNSVKSYQKSIDALNKYIAINPIPEIYYKLGKMYYKQKMYTEATAAYQKILEKKPDFLYAHFEIARCQAGLDPETSQGLAKPHYEKVIELGEAAPDKYKKELIEAYVYMGYYLYLQKKFHDSLPYYEKVLTLDPEHKQATEMVPYLKKTKQP